MRQWNFEIYLLSRKRSVYCTMRSFKHVHFTLPHTHVSKKVSWRWCQRRAVLACPFWGTDAHALCACATIRTWVRGATVCATVDPLPFGWTDAHTIKMYAAIYTWMRREIVFATVLTLPFGRTEAHTISTCTAIVARPDVTFVSGAVWACPP